MTKDISDFPDDDENTQDSSQDETGSEDASEITTEDAEALAEKEDAEALAEKEEEAAALAEKEKKAKAASRKKAQREAKKKSDSEPSEILGHEHGYQCTGPHKLRNPGTGDMFRPSNSGHKAPRPRVEDSWIQCQLSAGVLEKCPAPKPVTE